MVKENKSEMYISLKDTHLHTHGSTYITVYACIHGTYTFFFIYIYMHIHTYTKTYWNSVKLGIHFGFFFVCVVSEHNTYIHRFETPGVSLDMELFHFVFDCFAIL